MLKQYLVTTIFVTTLGKIFSTVCRRFPFYGNGTTLGAGFYLIQRGPELLQLMLNTENPRQLLKSWFDEACLKADNPETQGTAMTVSTVDSEGQPSARVVLLKEFSPEGFVFFTNYDSLKGKDLANNNRISANFHWPHLIRQVNVRGKARKIPQQNSEAYWKTRPRKSQISQCISRQSQPLTNGQSLQQLYDSFAAEWEGKDIPCPDNWGGYEIVPEIYQFWVGKDNRLHDRVEFVIESGRWVSRQIFP